jgi:Flp pilus assembly secretin CpaC/tetratricopeptide (TPR) repeat protein
LDRRSVHAKCLRTRSVLIILTPVLLVATTLVRAAQSQGGDDATMRRVVEHYMRVGTEQYDRAYYADAQKTFQMAEEYKEYLDPAESRKLDSWLEKAGRAAAERKKAIEARNAGQELLRKGDRAAARAQLESIKGNQYLTGQERLEIAGMLREMGQTKAAGAGEENVAPPAMPASGQSATSPTKPVAGEAADQEKARISQLYLESMTAYHSGDLNKAKEGFTEVLKSGQTPAPIAEAIRGYLAEIEASQAKSNLAPQAGSAELKTQTAPSPGAMSVMGAAVPYQATTEPAGGASQSEVARIQELYNRSWQLYSAGELEAARRGFVEVAQSGLFTAPEGKRPEDYITAIDRLLAQSGEAQVPGVGLQPATTPQTAVPAATGQGLAGGGASYIEVINSRRNAIRSYTQAVVNDAVEQVQKCLAQGNFDKAQEVIFNAQSIVNQNQLYLGDELYGQYMQRLDEATKSVSEATGIRDKQQADQKHQQAIEAQRELRDQAETDRRQRIAELMDRAKAYQEQQRYEAALGQLEAILAIDPLNDDALRLKQTIEDMVNLRKQLDIERLSAQERAKILTETEESGVPYSDEMTYPKDWREIIEKPARKAQEPFSLDPANALVYEQLERAVDLSSLTPETPLSEAIDTIKRSVEPPLNIVVLWRELLDNAQIDPTTPIRMDGLSNVRLGTVLDNLVNALSNLELGTQIGYVVDKGVITIGTQQSLPLKKMVTHIYDITDLVSEPSSWYAMGAQVGMSSAMTNMSMLMSSPMMAMSYINGSSGGTTGTTGGGMGGMMGGMGGMGGMMGGMGGMGGMMGGMGGMGGYGGGMGGMSGMGGGMMGGMGGMGGYGGGGMGGMGGGMGGGYGGGYGGGMGGGGGGMTSGVGMAGYLSGILAQSLRYIIEQSIAPDTWFDTSATGEGTVVVYPDAQPKKLVIYQTPEVHAQIRDMLDQLRKSLSNEVSIEARFLAVTENFLEDIGLDVDFRYNLGGDWGIVTVSQDSYISTQPAASSVSGTLGSSGIAGSGSAIPASLSATGGYGSILDDLQVSLLLRATQGRADSKSLSAPKVTVMSGESALFSVVDWITFAVPPQTGAGTTNNLGGTTTTQQILAPQALGTFPVGSSLAIAPTISKDRTHVLLNITVMQTDLLRYRQHTVQAPVAGGTTTAGGQTTAATVLTYQVEVPETETASVLTRVSVPDRGTLLLGGHKLAAAAEREAGVPVLSKIPIVGRLFSNRSSIRDEKVLLVLVKPIILLQDEKDQEAIAAMEERDKVLGGL